MTYVSNQCFIFKSSLQLQYTHQWKFINLLWTDNIMMISRMLLITHSAAHLLINPAWYFYTTSWHHNEQVQQNSTTVLLTYEHRMTFKWVVKVLWNYILPKVPLTHCARIGKDINNQYVTIKKQLKGDDAVKHIMLDLERCLSTRELFIFQCNYFFGDMFLKKI